MKHQRIKRVMVDDVQMFGVSKTTTDISIMVDSPRWGKCIAARLLEKFNPVGRPLVRDKAWSFMKLGQMCSLEINEGSKFRTVPEIATALGSSIEDIGLTCLWLELNDLVQSKELPRRSGQHQAEKVFIPRYTYIAKLTGVELHFEQVD